MKREMYGREFMYGPDTNLERERFIKECSERHIRDGDRLLAMCMAELCLAVDTETKNPQMKVREERAEKIGFGGYEEDRDTFHETLKKINKHLNEESKHGR